MNIGKQLQNELTVQGEKIVKAASFQILPMIVIAGQLVVLWLSGKENLFPDRDTLMTIISCCAQIIAGLYGITLAGYTFFLSRIDGLMASDGTLDYVVGSVKQRYKILIWYITATVATTLFISVFLMYYPASGDAIPDYLYRLFCNEFVVFMGFATSLILYYSVSVVNPNCLEKEAQKLKRRLGGKAGAPGSVVEYISLYDRIEQRCNGLLPERVVSQLRENKGNHFEYTIELLQEHNVLLHPLIPDLRRIHRYYGCTVNCSTLSVSQDMCTLARKVLAFLEQIPARESR